MGSPLSHRAKDRREQIPIAVLEHKGDPEDRQNIYFRISWENTEETTWEPWNSVKYLTIVDDYILLKTKTKQSTD